MADGKCKEVLEITLDNPASYASYHFFSEEKGKEKEVEKCLFPMKYKTF